MFQKITWPSSQMKSKFLILSNLQEFIIHEVEMLTTQYKWRLLLKLVKICINRLMRYGLTWNIFYKNFWKINKLTLFTFALMVRHHNIGIVQIYNLHDCFELQVFLTQNFGWWIQTNKKIYMTFSELGHGKGPIECVDLVLKRTDDWQLLIGNDIKSASNFVDLFPESSVLVKKVSDREITTTKNKKDAILEIMKPTNNITWKRD